MTKHERHLLLIVDDDEAARYAKARTLGRAGFDVIETSSGTEALRLIEERKPSLVLLDVNLPDVSGWEVCRRIKDDARTATLPVLQMSASYVTEADTVRALEGGADACLTEPVEPPVLIATVRALLRARRAEEELREALARERTARTLAESASRTKDDFLATLSHELRSPLNAILIWVDLARSGRLGPDRVAHALEVIERNTRLQVRMVEELLDVSRIVSGKMRLDVATVELPPIAQAAVEAMQPLAEQKQVRLVARIDPAVRPVAGDAARLQQVFGNLLANAVKFTPEGGTVEVELTNTDGWVVASVTDTGAGIPDELLPYVFERFRQGDASTTRSQGGLGIGLAIVRHLVELHGGKVSAESEGKGRGSTFRFKLPVVGRSARPARPARERATGAAAPAAADLRGLSILVVDDERDAREAISIVLAAAGARVTQAASVGEALHALSDDLPDLVVSDIAMPGEDGYSLVRRLRDAASERMRALPVIALTAYDSADDRQRIAAAGFDAQVAKPTDPMLLTASVDRVARRRA